MCFRLFEDSSRPFLNIFLTAYIQPDYIQPAYIQPAYPAAAAVSRAAAAWQLPRLHGDPPPRLSYYSSVRRDRYAAVTGKHPSQI